MTEPSHSETAPIASRRIDAARHLVRPHQFRESLVLTRQPSLVNSALVGVQAAVSAAIVLPLVELSPWPHLIGYASLGTLAALFGRLAPRGGRGRIVLMAALTLVFAVFAMSGAAWLGASLPVQLLLLAFASGLFFFVSVSGRFGPPGALIFIFAASAAMGEVDSAAVIFERTAAIGLAAALAWLIAVLSEPLRQREKNGQPFPAETLRPLSHQLFAAARIAIAAAVAAFAAYAIGAQHAAWAAMGTVAVMQGSHLHITMTRALQRMAGSLVGAVLVWLVLSLEPSVWELIALIAFLQIATELVIGSNYALGQILVTPMALLMTYLAARGAADASIAPERVLDTLLGAVIGIVLATAFSSLDDRVYLAHHQAAREKS